MIRSPLSPAPAYDVDRERSSRAFFGVSSKLHSLIGSSSRLPPSGSCAVAVRGSPNDAYQLIKNPTLGEYLLARAGVTIATTSFCSGVL